MSWFVVFAPAKRGTGAASRCFPDLFRAPGGVPCRDGHTALPRWAGSMQKGKDGSLVQRELSANAD